MREGVSISADDDTILVESVEWTESFPERSRGLLGRKALEPGRGMVIAPCSSVHTWFMRFALDLIFFSRDLRIVKTSVNVQPWRVVPGGWSSWGVLEVQTGWFPWSRVSFSDLLIVRAPEKKRV